MIMKTCTPVSGGRGKVFAIMKDGVADDHEGWAWRMIMKTCTPVSGGKVFVIMRGGRG